MTVDLTWQAEVPTLDAVIATLKAAVTGLRVDRNVIDGDPASPMYLVTLAGPGWPEPGNMAARQDVVTVRLLVTCIGTSVDLVTQLRAKAARALVGRNPAGGYWEALSVVGLRVVARDLTDRSLPPPSMGGGWANAALPVSILLQAAS